MLECKRISYVRGVSTRMPVTTLSIVLAQKPSPPTTTADAAR
jgi:hypothetical protein